MTRLLNHTSLAHLAAMAAALVFAWQISQTGLARTAVQFITPLMVIMAVHFLWMAFGKHLTRGYALTIFGRSAMTGILMMVLLLGGSILAPAPAQADAGEALGMILTVVFCVFIIAVIIGAAGLVVWAFFRILYWLFDKKKDPSDDDERLNDGASMVVALGLLGIASVEGVSDRFSFDSAGVTTASVMIDAPVADVWTAMQTATAPEFPLPGVSAFFPRPISVSTDEGTTLGAMRVVDFVGREGAGSLTLQVIEHSDTTASFEVQSDTTPYRGWIGFQRITYTVVADGAQTRLDTTLTYERRLSPSWFFAPAMAGAGNLSMGVLGRDVKARAEAL